MPTILRRVCVFTGSRPGSHPDYAEGARRLGETLAGRGIGLVYGGASVGLMGVVADSVLAAGGEVIGVIPDWLMQRELGHKGLKDLRIVRSMHERKALMADLSDGFVAMPGGFGTFDELFEIVTWAQIGLHGKPVGLYDVRGYFGPVWQLFDHMVAEGFAAAEHKKLVLRNASPSALLDELAAYEAPSLGQKWVDIGVRG